MAESSPRKKIKCHQTIPENVPLPPTYLKVLPHVAPRTQDRPGYIKRGIPDVNRPPPANNIEHKVPCDNLKITDTLLKEFRISLQQGIPDAFKIHDLSHPFFPEGDNPH
ncbi:uncharacterized protein LOC135171109 [Diachasmimorpha longicaudata]|uniref:uncharacterized protein LOC135171109 n=1 Tax=Diachasmimorpha longicaudata TaxID=58733 RepID=UPI0030B88DE1